MKLSQFQLLKPQLQLELLGSCELARTLAVSWAPFLQKPPCKGFGGGLSSGDARPPLWALAGTWGNLPSPGPKAPEARGPRSPLVLHSPHPLPQMPLESPAPLP